MAKKRSIVSYDKLSPELRKDLLKSFPDGFGSALTTIKTPTGETLEAVIWETEEIIYLVKITKMLTNALDLDEDDDDDFGDIAKPDDFEEEEEEEDEKPKKKKKSSDYDDDEEDDDDDSDEEEEEDEY